jgi:hypothetical protein
MSTAFKSRYVPDHPEKYKGNPSNICCRSSWERAVCRWLDHNSKVTEWSSEEVVIPYICKTDGRAHRYFMDFYVKLSSGKVLLVEIKPENQTRPPTPKGTRKSRVFIEQVMTYAKNASKWVAAKDYCDVRGWEFRIWTEVSLNKLGIRIQK